MKATDTFHPIGNLVLAALVAVTQPTFSPAQATLPSADAPTLNPPETVPSTSALITTPLPPPISMSVDMTGIITLAVLVVVVTVVGMVWGGASIHRKNRPKC